MKYVKCEKNVAGDAVAIMVNINGNEIPYYPSDLKTLFINTSERLTEVEKAKNALDAFINPTSPVTTTKNYVGKTFSHHGTQYEIINHDGEEFTFTDGKSIYSWDRDKMTGFQNTGTQKHKLCTGFNPKPYYPDNGLLNELNAVVSSSSTSNHQFMGKAFQFSQGSDKKAYVFINPYNINKNNNADVECLMVENGTITTINVSKSELTTEIPLKDFLSETKDILSQVLRNDLTPLLLKEI